MMNANSVSTSIENPSTGKTASAPMIEIGTPMATQSASRRRRKRARTTNTSANPP